MITRNINYKINDENNIDKFIQTNINYDYLMTKPQFFRDSIDEKKFMSVFKEPTSNIEFTNNNYMEKLLMIRLLNLN